MKIGHVYQVLSECGYGDETFRLVSTRTYRCQDGGSNFYRAVCVCWSHTEHRWVDYPAGANYTEVRVDDDILLLSRSLEHAPIATDPLTGDRLASARDRAIRLGDHDAAALYDRALAGDAAARRAAAFVLRMSGGMQQEAPRTERGLRQTVADTEHIPDPADHMLEDLAYGATRAGIGKCPGYDGVIIQMWERP